MTKNDIKNITLNELFQDEVSKFLDKAATILTTTIDNTTFIFGKEKEITTANDFFKQKTHQLESDYKQQLQHLNNILNKELSISNEVLYESNIDVNKKIDLLNKESEYRKSCYQKKIDDIKNQGMQLKNDETANFQSLKSLFQQQTANIETKYDLDLKNANIYFQEKQNKYEKVLQTLHTHFFDELNRENKKANDLLKKLTIRRDLNEKSKIELKKLDDNLVTLSDTYNIQIKTVDKKDIKSIKQEYELKRNEIISKKKKLLSKIDHNNNDIARQSAIILQEQSKKISQLRATLLLNLINEDYYFTVLENKTELDKSILTAQRNCDLNTVEQQFIFDGETNKLAVAINEAQNKIQVNEFDLSHQQAMLNIKHEQEVVNLTREKVKIEQHYHRQYLKMTYDLDSELAKIKNECALKKIAAEHINGINHYDNLIKIDKIDIAYNRLKENYQIINHFFPTTIQAFKTQDEKRNSFLTSDVFENIIARAEEEIGSYFHQINSEQGSICQELIKPLLSVYDNEKQHLESIRFIAKELQDENLNSLLADNLNEVYQLQQKQLESLKQIQLFIEDEWSKYYSSLNARFIQEKLLYRQFIEKVKTELQHSNNNFVNITNSREQAYNTFLNQITCNMDITIRKQTDESNLLQQQINQEAALFIGNLESRSKQLIDEYNKNTGELKQLQAKEINEINERLNLLANELSSKTKDVATLIQKEIDIINQQLVLDRQNHLKIKREFELSQQMASENLKKEIARLTKMATSKDEKTLLYKEKSIKAKHDLEQIGAYDTYWWRK